MISICSPPRAEFIWIEVSDKDKVYALLRPCAESPQVKNNQNASPFCGAAGLHGPRRERGSDLRGTSNFNPHTRTKENKRYIKKKNRRKVLLSFPFALVFAEDQPLNVLFSRTWLDLRGRLIAELHRPKVQHSTILKRQARWKGTEV